MFWVVRLVAHADALTVEYRHLTRVAEEAEALVVVLLAIRLPVLPGEEPEHAEWLGALGALEAALVPRLVHGVDARLPALDRVPAAGACGVEHLDEVVLAVGVVVVALADFGPVAKVLQTHLAAQVGRVPGHPERSEDVPVQNRLVARCAHFHLFVLFICLFCMCESLCESWTDVFVEKEK